MTLKYVPMPLYEDAAYFYRVSLEGRSYIFSAYYNERAEGWFFGLKTEDGVDVVVGERLVANYPILIDYALPNLTGYLFLEPIGKSIERYRTDPALLAKYFKLFYIYNDDQE